MVPEIPHFEQIPKTMTPESSNLDVRLFVFDRLLKYSDYRTRHEAWNLARLLVGNGEGVFAPKEDYWTKQSGDPIGPMLFSAIQREKNNSETDLSNLFCFESKMLNLIGRYHLAVSPLHCGDAYFG